jgi:hypothetical protein
MRKIDAVDGEDHHPPIQHIEIDFRLDDAACPARRNFDYSVDRSAAEDQRDGRNSARLRT